MMRKTEGKTHSPHVGARIPVALHEEFIRMKEATGKSETQILNEAIAAYLGVQTEATVPDIVTQLRGDVAELQQEVSVILGKFHRLAIG
jgi:hypothetical protein